jgi:hypothetical protein
MKICAISQPVYLPWIGYFHLVARANQFVFLDDAQFSKNGFGNRNRIATQPEPTWLTVPVRKGKLAKSFRETLIDDSQNWRAKHLKSIQLAYRKAPAFEPIFSILESKLNDRGLDNLAELSLSIIEALAKYLQLPTQFARASQVPAQGDRSARILQLCRHFACGTYISAAGARPYIEEDGILLKSELRVHFVDIASVPYPQVTTPEFIPQMSAIDLLFNLPAAEALHYILNCDKSRMVT